MQLSASISFMFREVPLLARFAAARAAGFAGVEIQRVAEGDPADMARAAREAGIEVALVNVSAGDYTAGGDGLSGVPGREEAFLEAFERGLAAAETLGAHHVHLGPSRVPAGVSRGACLRTYVANVRLALGMSRPVSASLLVEAMNRVEAPTALFADVNEAADVVRRIGDPRLGLQFDVYHVAMNGEDPVAAFGRLQTIARHVQFADVPGRHEPGSGTLDIPAILREIDRCGYTGWLGAEYHPLHDTAGGLGWMAGLQARSPA